MMTIFRAGLLLCAAGASLPGPVWSQPRAAAPRLQTVQMVAREQQLAAFLTDLHGQMNMPVAISPSVNKLGYVNGSFNKTPQKIYQEIASAFGLVNYYDGAVMYIVTAGEVQTRTYSPGARMAGQLMRSAAQLGFLNNGNTLRATASGTLVATGARRFLEQIEEMMKAEGTAPSPAAPNGEELRVEELPVPGITSSGAKGIAIKVFYLRYAKAQDSVSVSGQRQINRPGVASIVRSLVSSRPSTAGYGVIQRRQSRPKLGGSGLGGVPRDPGMLGYPINYQDDDGAPGQQQAPVAQGLPPVASLPQMADMGGDPGQARIEADTRLNAVIVRDQRDRMPVYEQLIRQLDVEPQLVEIEATIVDVFTDVAQQLGINWRFNDGKQDILFGNGTASDKGLLNIGAQITPQGGGLNISTVIGSANQFISRINLLAEKGAARIVTRPQVMTLSNEEAVFDNSDTFYVRVAGRNDVDLFNVSVGTVLRVTPAVFRDRGESRIRMDILIEDGKIRPGSVDGIPIVNKSSVSTQAIMLQGQSLLIGGLVQDVRSKNESKIPYAGDIPVLGNAFKSTSKNERRTERLFLISPRLASMTAPRTQPAPTPQEYLPPITAKPRTYTPRDQLPATQVAAPARAPEKSALRAPVPTQVLPSAPPAAPRAQVVSQPVPPPLSKKEQRALALEEYLKAHAQPPLPVRAPPFLPSGSSYSEGITDDGR